MIKLWNNVEREDVMIEVIPGIWTLDERIADKLDWTSYLSHMHELIRSGVCHSQAAVREHFDDLTFMIFGERTRIERGTYPTEAEGMAFRCSEDTWKLVDDLVVTTLNMTEKDWPAYKMSVCKRYGIDPEEFDLAFE